MQTIGVDGVAQEYSKLSSLSTSQLECKNACIRDARCKLAVRDTEYCYLKDYPSKPGRCGLANGCWGFTPYVSYADLSSLPYNEIFKVQVSIFDNNTQTWSPMSEFSNELNTIISMSNFCPVY